jgi:hypothetical protein
MEGLVKGRVALVQPLDDRNRAGDVIEFGGEAMAGIITRIVDAQAGICNICVLPDGVNLTETKVKKNVRYDESGAPGTWAFVRK